MTPFYFKIKFLVCFLHSGFVFSQSTTDNRTYEVFDEIVGLETLPFSIVLNSRMITQKLLEIADISIPL